MSTLLSHGASFNSFFYLPCFTQGLDKEAFKIFVSCTNQLEAVEVDKVHIRLLPNTDSWYSLCKNLFLYHNSTNHLCIKKYQTFIRMVE